MAIYVGFIRPNGLDDTWAFFNVIFLQNLSAFIVGFYNTKILINLGIQIKLQMRLFMLH